MQPIKQRPLRRMRKQAVQDQGPELARGAARGAVVAAVVSVARRAKPASTTIQQHPQPTRR